MEENKVQYLEKHAMETKSKNKIGYWNNHLDKKYGKRGTAKRITFEVKAHAFITENLNSQSTKK